MSRLMRTRMHMTTAGISQVMECSLGVFGQQGHVEFKVCNLVEEILRTTIVCQSLERRTEPFH